MQKRRFLPRRKRRRDGQGRGLDSRQRGRRRPRPQGAAQAIDRLCAVCTFIRFEAHTLPFISPLADATSRFSFFNAPTPSPFLYPFSCFNAPPPSPY